MTDATPLEGDYDYIIVGAGSAGCVLANRLSADPNNRVLLLEAGGKDNWIWFHIPVGYLFAIGNPRSDWMFKTEPEPGLNGRALNYPRGKVIGGSSAINAMIYMRGQAADYDHWRQLGLVGWGWDDVLPLFKKQTDHFLGESEHHGVGGEWRIEAPRVQWALLDAFRKAAEEYGIKPIEDFNRGDNEGSAYFHVNQRRGRRWSAARGFLKPALNRANLRVETNCLAERVEFDGWRATGVTWRQNGAVKTARAQREVILSAGSIGSAQLLLLSGIGPGRELLDLGIPVGPGRPRLGKNQQGPLSLGRLDRLGATAAALRHRAGEGAPRPRRYGGARPARRRQEPAGSPAAAHDLQGRRREDAERDLSFAHRPRPDGPRLRATPARASHHGAVAARPVHALRPRARARQHPVPRAALVARQVRRSAARLSGVHHQRVQSSAAEPRARAPALGRSHRQAAHRAALSHRRRRPPRRRRQIGR